MIENLDILYNVTGQSLHFDAPEGRPSSITSSQVFENAQSDDSTEESALSGSAAVETNPDTTFDAASGFSQADPRICNLTATTGVSVARRYLATNAELETEWVDVLAIDDGASVTSRHELHNDFAAGATFESTRITHAIDSTWVATKNNISPVDPSPHYRWRLEYVVGGVTYVHYTYFDLVRHSGVSTVTALDVDRAYPWLGWLELLSEDDREDAGARVIREAYRQVKLDLAQAGKADEAARNREVLEDLVVHRAALIAVGRDLEAIERIERNQSARFNNFILTAKLDFDQDGSGAARPSTQTSVWRR